MAGGLHVKQVQDRIYMFYRDDRLMVSICHCLISFCSFSVAVERSKSASSQLAE